MENFIFNGINVTISDSKTDPSIKFTDQLFPSTERKIKLVGFNSDYTQETIKVQFISQIIDPTTQNIIKIESLPIRTMRQPYFDTFYNLNYNLSIGTIATRACLNNQLEHMQNYFGESIICYSFENDFKFFKPIEFKPTFTTETQTGNDATATLTIANNISGHNYQYTLNGVTQSNSTFVGLTNGNYTATVKDVTQSANLGFDVEVTKVINIQDSFIY